MSDLLNDLNEMQRIAVETTEGAVLVVAGAGSGKTRVLTHRIAYILENSLARPAEIMAITFTNKATHEMQERLSQMVGDTYGMWVSTIHGMCARILRKYVSHLDGFQAGFSIYSESEKERVLKRVLAECGVEEPSKVLREVKGEISRAKNLAISPTDYPNEGVGNIAELVSEVFPVYQAELMRCNAVDFDDLLTLTLELLQKDEDVLGELRQRFRYIHVDEFQDTNRVQYEIIRLLAGGWGNIFAVGDDDQSIYAFRGAVVEHMFSFQKDFPSVKVIKLEQNYRSTQNILDAANELIAENSHRMEKVLWTDNGKGSVIVCKSLASESAEATFVIGQIKKLMTKFGYRCSDFAVLMRINALSRAFEQEAVSYGLPYKVYGGFKFFERKEIKDAIAYLQLIVNPFDEEALRRVINTPKRGIGDVALLRLKEYADASKLPLFEMLLQTDALPAALAKKFAPFADLMRTMIVESQLREPAAFVAYLVRQSGLYDSYDQTTEEGSDKRSNLDEFVASAESYFKDNPAETLSSFLESVSLMSDMLEEKADDAVIIGTIHSVKGLEFRVVFVVGLEQGVFPGLRITTDIDEERRLMYVAITRAREKLCLTTVRSRFMYGERKDCFPSEFYQAVSKSAVVLADDPAPAYTKRDSFAEKPRKSGFEKKPAESAEYVSFAPPKPKKEDEKDISAFRPGVVVSHSRFGVGTIIDVSGDFAHVAFKGFGIKQLSLRIAPLTVVDT